MDFPNRMPLDDAAAENERVNAYWAWLDSQPSIPSSGLKLADTPDGGSWFQLENEADADFEAFHMRHSIGHSWAKYSSYGDLMSLRSPEGIPQVTALIVNGNVVHVREDRNARLSMSNTIELGRMAIAAGWNITPEPETPDTHLDETSANTVFRYLRRNPDNTKVFKEIVLEGRLSAETLEALSETIDHGRHFIPSTIGMPQLAIGDDADVTHEILRIQHNDIAPTGHGTAADFAETWLQARAHHHL